MLYTYRHSLSLHASLPIPPMSFIDRPQTLGEEIANSISHGLGALGALLAAPLLIVGATRQGDLALVAGTAIFAATMCLLYLASPLYPARSEEHTSELQSLMRTSYAVFCLKQKQPEH